MIGVIALEVVDRIKTFSPGACQGSAIDYRAGGIGRAIRPVGAGRQQGDPGRPLQLTGRGQGELLVAPSLPVAAQCDGGLAAREQQKGALGAQGPYLQGILLSVGDRTRIRLWRALER